MRFIPTEDFNKDTKRLAKKYPSILRDLDTLFEKLEQNPYEGKSLGNNTYKVRMAISSKKTGKSGGARVITWIQIINDTIHLLTMYDKSEINNITDAYLDELRKSIE